MADVGRLVDFVRQQDPRLDESAALSKLASALACDVGKWRRHELRVLNRGRLLVTLERSLSAFDARHHAAVIEAGRWVGVPLPTDIPPLSKAKSDHAIRRWAWFVDRLANVGVTVDRESVSHMSRSAQLVRGNHRRRVETALRALTPGAQREAWLGLLRAKEGLHETDARCDAGGLLRLQARARRVAAGVPASKVSSSLATLVDDETAAEYRRRRDEAAATHTVAWRPPRATSAESAEMRGRLHNAGPSIWSEYPAPVVALDLPVNPLETGTPDKPEIAGMLDGEAAAVATSC